MENVNLFEGESMKDIPETIQIIIAYIFVALVMTVLVSLCIWMLLYVSIDNDSYLNKCDTDKGFAARGYWYVCQPIQPIQEQQERKHEYK